MGIAPDSPGEIPVYNYWDFAHIGLITKNSGCRYAPALSNSVHELPVPLDLIAQLKARLRAPP